MMMICLGSASLELELWWWPSGTTMVGATGAGTWWACEWLDSEWVWSEWSLLLDLEWLRLDLDSLIDFIVVSVSGIRSLVDNTVGED